MNVFADGLFHAATWLLVVGAFVLTVRAWRSARFAPPWSMHVGLVLAGGVRSTWSKE